MWIGGLWKLALLPALVSKREKAGFASHNFADDSETAQHQQNSSRQLHDYRANMSFGKLYTYDVSLLVSRAYASVCG